ncbi:MAG TPA: glycoside hydrolase family 43 protein, partial [Rhizomicrobium sp.]|nr:glycoside hydrolase family 43 protein [Rhizomicrobium sp.]
AKTIDGEWSDPAYINSSGFDPSLFHDDDGKKWFVNMLWDHRPGQNRFAGIVAQEYSPADKKLIGERVNIFKGTPLGLTEAPHLYKRDGFYYLLTAEGGTAWNHAVTMARSRNLLGPYELHPDTYILSARTRPDAPLQRAGHADLVETQGGNTYMAYLCGRPLKNRGRCTLGRETAIQKMQWQDGWLYTEGEPGLPQLQTPAPKLKPHSFPPAPTRDDFDAPALPIDFQWLRTPYPETIFSLTARPGYLRLYGRESIGSLFTQALVGRRQQSHCYSAETVLDFEPAHFQQAAGLVCYYGGNKFHYLHVTHDETHGKHIRVMSALPDAPVGDAFTPPIPLPLGPIRLRVEVDEERLYFAWASGQAAWQRLPQTFDASILSDEAQLPGTANFTGAFVGMACQDMAGTAAPADFDWFSYSERAFVADPFAVA